MQSHLTAPNTEEGNTPGTDETPRLGSHELEGVTNAASNSSDPVPSEEVAPQIRAATEHSMKRV